LGLSVCDAIIEESGGALDVSSRPGEGATFIILLPEEVVDRTLRRPMTRHEYWEKPAPAARCALKISVASDLGTAGVRESCRRNRLGY